MLPYSEEFARFLFRKKTEGPGMINPGTCCFWPVSLQRSRIDAQGARPGSARERWQPDSCPEWFPEKLSCRPSCRPSYHLSCRPSCRLSCHPSYHPFCHPSCRPFCHLSCRLSCHPSFPELPSWFPECPSSVPECLS